MREPSSVEWAICPPYFAVIGMEFSEFQPALITWPRARDANTKSIMTKRLCCKPDSSDRLEEVLWWRHAQKALSEI